VSIGLYWWRDVPNFGDHLSPLIAAHVSGRSVVYAEVVDAQMIGLGSVLPMVAVAPEPKRRIHVWGSGYLAGHQPLVAASRIKVWAVRGTLTRHKLGASRSTPLGDPGLFAACALDIHARPRIEVGICGHHTHYDTPEWTRFVSKHPEIFVIDVRRPAIDVARDIASCRVLVSSSLHGLVLADALAIPNRWIELTPALCQSSWKFHDYYLGTGRSAAHPVFVAGGDIEQLIDQTLRAYEPPDIEPILERLGNAFPAM
jgi:pyruvyltransferase